MFVVNDKNQLINMTSVKSFKCVYAAETNKFFIEFTKFTAIATKHFEYWEYDNEQERDQAYLKLYRKFVTPI